MGLLWTVIIGFFVGLIARAVMPGRQIMGIILTTLLGIGGALLAGYAAGFCGAPVFLEGKPHCARKPGVGHRER
jgi:uncharacterized membrane protein YeaQ/YmgE (transglycosylase-associated protein family)